MWKLFTYSKEPAFITKYENNEDENTLWFPFGDIFCYYEIEITVTAENFKSLLLNRMNRPGMYHLGSFCESLSLLTGKFKVCEKHFGNGSLIKRGISMETFEYLDSVDLLGLLNGMCEIRSQPNWSNSIAKPINRNR